MWVGAVVDQALPYLALNEWNVGAVTAAALHVLSTIISVLGTVGVPEEKDIQQEENQEEQE